MRTASRTPSTFSNLDLCTKQVLDNVWSRWLFSWHHMNKRSFLIIFLTTCATQALVSQISHVTRKQTNILKISQLNLAISFSSSYSLYKDTNLPILTTLFNTTGTHNIQLFMWPSISLSSSVIAINTLTIQLFSTRLQARVIFSPVLSFLPEQTHRETTRAGQKHTSFSSN